MLLSLWLVATDVCPSSEMLFRVAQLWAEARVAVAGFHGVQLSVASSTLQVLYKSSDLLISPDTSDMSSLFSPVVNLRNILFAWEFSAGFFWFVFFFLMVTLRCYTSAYFQYLRLAILVTTFLS